MIHKTQNINTILFPKINLSHYCQIFLLLFLFLKQQQIKNFEQVIQLNVVPPGITHISIISLCILCLSWLIYNLLYTNTKIKKTIKNYCFFTAFFIIILSPILCICLLLGLDFTKPILFTDIFTKTFIMEYYILLAIILSCIIIGLLLFLYFKFETTYKHNIPLPQIYEEIYKLLLEYDAIILSPFCHRFIILVFESKTFYQFWQIMQTLCINIIPSINVIVIFNFLCLSGDFYFILYLALLNIFAWIFKLLEFIIASYIQTYLEDTFQMVDIFYTGSHVEPFESLNDHRVLYMDPDFFELRLTEIGKKEGLLNDSLLYIKLVFFQCCVVKFLLFTQREYDKNINLGFLLIKLLFLSYITYNLWILHADNVISLMLSIINKPPAFLKQDKLKLNALPFTQQRSITRIVTLSPKYQKILEQQTSAYKRNHALLVDFNKTDKDGNVLLQGCLTTGKGGPGNAQSKLINNSMNFKNEPVAQRAIFIDKKQLFIPQTMCKIIYRGDRFIKDEETDFYLSYYIQDYDSPIRRKRNIYYKDPKHLGYKFNPHKFTNKPTPVPPNNAKVPPNNTKVPPNNTKIPNNNTKIPNNNAKVPNNNAKVPNNNLQVPTNNSKGGDTIFDLFNK